MPATRSRTTLYALGLLIVGSCRFGYEYDDTAQLLDMQGGSGPGTSTPRSGAGGTSSGGSTSTATGGGSSNNGGTATAVGGAMGSSGTTGTSGTSGTTG